MSIDAKTQAKRDLSSLLEIYGTPGKNGQVPTQWMSTLAKDLSATVGQDPPWGWRYIHNVLHEKLDPSKKMITAINRLGAMQDDTPELIAKTVDIFLRAEKGTVVDGAVVLRPSRKCINPACPVHFIPIVHNQRACTKKCSKEYRKFRRSK